MGSPTLKHQIINNISTFRVMLRAGNFLHHFLLERVWRESAGPLNAQLRLGNVSIRADSRHSPQAREQRHRAVMPQQRHKRGVVGHDPGGIFADDRGLHAITVLTDNGIQFAEQLRNRSTAYSRLIRFDMICEANGIEHRLTKPNHPWSS